MDYFPALSLPALPLVLRKVRDLIYYDGPLLSLFVDESGQSYLYNWCDCDAQCNRWLVFAVAPAALEAYEGGQKSLRSLIEEAPAWFVVDMDTNAAVQRVWQVQASNLPSSYWPDPDSFYSPELRFI